MPVSHYDAPMPDYRVQLQNTYSGPMDLLLYLIRRDWIDVYDIPIAKVLGDYVSYVRMMEVIDPEAVGEFLVLAATLMEIKSRMLLPKPPPEENDDDSLDPRADLVRQLLAYRAFREAAGKLADRATARSQQFSRPGIDLAEEQDDVEIEEVQVWDLLAAFNKLLSATGRQAVQHEVLYDDTPITLHAADVLDRLSREGPSLFFEQIFEGRRRGEMIGLFLALLELIRQARVRVDQDAAFDRITVHLLDATPITTISELEDADRPEIEGDDEDYPLESTSEQEEAEARAEEQMLDELLDEDEEDEFSRRINAVQIGDVDLGRVKDEPGEEESA